MATPQDAGTSREFVAAGSIMEWIDKAGYACAAGWSNSYCVTAYVGNVHFTRRVRPGEVMEATAQIIHTGRTSMQVHVRLSGADARELEYTPAMHCLLVFVAVDESGTPRAVPTWTPSTEREEVLERNALSRLSTRRSIAAEMRQARFTDAGTTPRTIFRFLAVPHVANLGGKAHGGTVMRWVNEAAFACAAGWASVDAAVVYTGGIHFLSPVQIGHIVEVDARLIHTTPATMHLSVHVRSGPPAQSKQLSTVLQCMTIFEDRPGSGTPVRQLELVSAEDHALDALARNLVLMRLALPRVPEGA